MNKTRKAGIALAALAALGGTSSVSAQAEPAIDFGIYSTGVDNDGKVLLDGVVNPSAAGETHYKIVSAPSGSKKDVLVRTSAGGAPIGSYTGTSDSKTSAWIGPNNNATLDSVYGDYDYQTTFTLTKNQAQSFVLSGVWSTDNSGSAINLNGQSTGTHTTGDTSFNDPATPFTISSGFQEGANTLDFVVYNGSGSTALRVDHLTATVTVAPEPSSFAVFGFLGLGMAGLMLKARKRSASAA